MASPQLTNRATVKGGDKLARYLKQTADRLATGAVVRVGFLEDATYPAVARRADKLLKGLDALNSVGPFQKGTKPTALRDYRRRLKTRVGPSKPAVILPVATVAFWNNFGNTRIPARPFFTNTVREDSPLWGAMVAQAIKKQRYNSRLVLQMLGQHIKDRLVKAIVDWPADNSPLTVAIKGFNKGLIASGVMQRAVDFQVVQK